MVRWNPEILNKNIAPEISNFTCADIPNLENEFDQHKYWLTNHFFNTVMRVSFKPPTKQYVLNYIFRTQTFFRLYHEAVNATNEYLKDNDPHNPKISKYFESISIWESVFLNFAIAFNLIKKLNNNENLFNKGDGSEEERAYNIHNEIKHCSGNILGEQWNENSTIPIWLTNNGISSHENSITYIEISELVKEIAEFTNKLQDPLTFKES